MKLKRYRLFIPVMGYAAFFAEGYTEQEAKENFNLEIEWDSDFDPDLDSNNWIIEEVKNEDYTNG